MLRKNSRTASRKATLGKVRGVGGWEEEREEEVVRRRRGRWETGSRGGKGVWAR